MMCYKLLLYDFLILLGNFNFSFHNYSTWLWFSCFVKTYEDTISASAVYLVARIDVGCYHSD